ncbi:SRPBCC family protein [uncultured Cellulomonas sp.]|uniref:SRPBCC family protein n=1 Tax=uncultured Cellulomonas sp. TaxID=189682 RepID=UPI00261769E7|nr:SRPBCC family protein [uncultured Cellulomonas sp.]
MAVVEKHMRCPAESVVEILRDGWSYAAWVVGASRIRSVDARWPAPGSTIHHSAGAWPLVINDKTVARRWDGESRLELQARGWPLGEARIRIEVVPDPHGGCTVTMTEDAVRGPGTLVPRPLRTLLLVPRNRETLDRLALLAEGRGLATGSSAA